MSRPARRGSQRLWDTLSLPLAIFAVTVCGLSAALLGDGWWHGLSWLFLAMPLAIIAVAVLRRPSARKVP